MRGSSFSLCFKYSGGKFEPHQNNTLSMMFSIYFCNLLLSHIFDFSNASFSYLITSIKTGWMDLFLSFVWDFVVEW